MSGVTRKFTEVISTLSRGSFDRHLNDQLRQMVETLEQQPEGVKSKAELTVKLTLEFDGLERIDAKAESKVKLPETVRFMKTPFWVVEGTLSTEHPSQHDFFNKPLKVVDGKAVENKEDVD